MYDRSEGEYDPQLQGCEMRFPFIDNIYLRSLLVHNKRMALIVEFENEKGDFIEISRLMCIHVAVTQDFDTYPQKIESSEHFPEINIEEKDMMFAFNSWIEGIAIMGINGIILQLEIEKVIPRVRPISRFIFHAMSCYNDNYTDLFLDFIEKKSVFENVRADNFIISNLYSLSYNQLLSRYTDLKKRFPTINIGEIILSNFNDNGFNFSLDIFKNFLKIIPAEELYSIFKIKMHMSFKKEILRTALKSNSPLVIGFFSDSDYDVRKYCASLEELTKYDEFKDFFTDKDRTVRYQAAKNRYAVKFDEYKILFRDSSAVVRQGVASNPKAVKFDEFNLLFHDKNKIVKKKCIHNKECHILEGFKTLFSDTDKKIRLLLARNKNTPKLKEFGMLLKDKESDIVIASARNNQGHIHPDYHTTLSQFTFNIAFQCITEDTILNENIAKTLFNSGNDIALEMLAKSNNATKYEEYRTLFKSKNDCIRRKVALNEKAVRFDEYRFLFSDSDERVRINCIFNHNAHKFPEFLECFKGRDFPILRILASNEYYTDFNEFKYLFDCGDIHILTLLAYKEFATKFDEFRTLFSIDNPQLRKGLAYNKGAVKFDEYNSLFDGNYYIILSIAHNEEAVFCKRFPELFDDKRINILRALAQNYKSYRLKEFGKLFHTDDEVLLSIIKGKNLVINNLQSGYYNEYLPDNIKNKYRK